MTPKERFDAFFAGKPIDRPMSHPLCMTFAARVAGIPYRRYASDYRALAGAQAQVCRMLGVEILSVCSDPVRELSNLGGNLTWFEDEAPAPDPNKLLLKERRDLARFRPGSTEGGRMQDRVEAVRRLSGLWGHMYPILGWVEGPISLAAVMRGVTPLMEDLLDDEPFCKDLFAFCTDVALGFAARQVKEGANMIGFGDAPASLVGPRLYEKYILPEERRLVRGIQALGVPVRVHICGNVTAIGYLIAQLGAEMIDLDFVTDFEQVVPQMPPGTAVLGNLDPVREVRDGTPASIQAALRRCQEIVGPRYVAGAGCEIPAATPPENVAAFRLDAA